MRTRAALLLLAAATGCAAGRPRPGPAPLTPEVAPAPGGTAAGPAGGEVREPGDTVAPRPFTSDGCSLFPDQRLVLRGSWCDCCLRHDLAYWRGGTEAERLAADEALRDCVKERTGDPVLATMMFAGVRASGAPAFPTNFRWGYGWAYGRGYGPLTAEEHAGADRMLAPVLKANPGLTCKAAPAEVTPSRP